MTQFVPTDRGIAWCACWLLIGLIPLGIAWSVMDATPPGPARLGAALIFLACYAPVLLIDLVCIAILGHALWKSRIRTPVRARWTIAAALLQLMLPIAYLYSV
jgi:uncharacterized membrane protein